MATPASIKKEADLILPLNDKKRLKFTPTLSQFLLFSFTLRFHKIGIGSKTKAHSKRKHKRPFHFFKKMPAHPYVLVLCSASKSKPKNAI